MKQRGQCLILLDAGDRVFFLGRHGEHTEQAKDILLFCDEMAARTYIDKHGIDRIASIRHIVQRKRSAPQ